MARKEAKFKDGNKTMTVVIDDVPPLQDTGKQTQSAESDAMTSSETFSIMNADETRILTITIAE